MAYSVGTVTVDVAPSLDGFHRKLQAQARSIGDIEVPVSPDLDGFRRDLKAMAEAATKATDLEVEVDADTAKAAAEIKKLAKSTQVHLSVDAKIDEARRKLDQLSRDRKAQFDVEARTKKAAMEITRLAQPREAWIDLNVDADTTAAQAQIERIARTQRVLIKAEVVGDKAWGKFLPALGNFSKSLATVSALAGSATVAVAGVAPSVAAVGVAAAQATVAVGGLAAAMAPAALGAAALSVGVLKTAFKDMGAAAGEATQQANAALTSMKTSLSDVAKQAQESFWAGFSNFGQLSALIAPVGAALNGVASSMGQAASNFTAFVTAGVGLGAFNTILGNSAIGASNLSMALSNALKGVTLFGAVGAPLFAQLTARINEMAAAWSQRMVTAFQDGSMQAWFDSAIAKVQTFWGVLQNLGGIVSGVFQAMAAAGGGVASVFADVIAKTNQWVNSGPGMAAMTGFFSDMQSAVAAVAPLFGQLAQILVTQLAPIMAQVFQTLAPYASTVLENFSRVLSVISPAIPVVASAIGMLASALSYVLAALSPVISALGFLSPVLAPLAAGFMAVSAGLRAFAFIQTLAPAFSLFGSILSTLGSILSSVVMVAVRGLITAFTALWGVMMANPIIAIIAAVVAIGVALWAFFTKTETGRQMWANFVNFLKNAWQSLVAAAQAVWNGLKAGWSALWNGIVAVAQTIWSGLTSAWNAFWNGLVSVVTTVGNAIATAWNWYLNQVQQNIQTVISVVTGIWNAFWNGLVNVVTTVGNAISTAWNWYINQVQQNVQTVVAVVTGIWNAFWNGLVFVVQFVGQMIMTAWNMVVMGLQMAFQLLVTIVSAVWNAFWNGLVFVVQFVGQMILMAWNMVVTGLQMAFQLLVTVVTTVWNAFWNGLVAVASAMGSAISAAWNALWNGVRSVFSAVVNFIRSAWNAAVSFVISMAQRVWSMVSNAFNSMRSAVTSTVSSMWASAKSTFSSGVSAVVSFVSSLPGKIRGIFASAGSWLISAGRNIMQGLLNGISSMVGAVIGKIRSVGSQIKSAFTGLLGIHSPSRVFMGYGENLAQGLAIGVDDKATVAESSAQNLAATTDKALDQALPKSKTFTPEVTAKDASVKATPIESVAALGKTVQKAYRSSIQPATRGIGNAMSKMGSNVVSATLGQAAPSMVQMANTSAQTANTVTQNTVGTISTAFTQTGRNIANTQQTQIEPALRATRESVVQTANTFGPATGLIARQWDAVRPATANPARFVINEVFNGGIVGMWNSVSELLGTKKMSNYVARFATGGYVSGPGGPTDDKIPAMLSNGEYVIKADTVRKVGVSALNDLNNGGGRYGGVFTGRTAKEVAGDANFLNVAVRRQGGGIAEGTPAWHALKRGYDWARSRNGRPYVFGGSANGAGGTDCSGFMSGIADVILGGSGARQWATMNFPGTQQGAWGPGLAAGFSIGYYNGGAGGGHTAGTIGGVIGMPAVNVESGGRNSRVKFGTSDAAGADHPQFRSRHHLVYVEGGGFVGSAGGGLSTADMVKSMIEPKKKALLDKVKAYSVPGLIGTLPQMTASKLIGAVETKTKKLAEEAGSSGGPIPPGTGAERWRDMAKRAMARVGFNANDERQVNAMIKQIQSESGGDPGVAQRIHDVNGTGESAGVGLLQIIPGTFAANRDPALPNDRRDPFANMVAALRYYKGRYGNDLTTMWGHGHGYDMGGWLQPGMNTTYNGFSKPEAILTPSESEAFVGVARRFNEDGGAGASYTGQHIENQYVVDPADIAWRTERGVKRAMREESIRV